MKILKFMLLSSHDNKFSKEKHADEWGKKEIQCRMELANSQNYAASRKKKDFIIKTDSFHQTVLQAV